MKDGKLGEIMEKVMESHGISKAQKSMNPGPESNPNPHYSSS